MDACVRATSPALSASFSTFSRSLSEVCVPAYPPFHLHAHGTCSEFKGYMVNELLKAADKFSPSDQWHVETLLSILIKARV